MKDKFGIYMDSSSRANTAIYLKSKNKEYSCGTDLSSRLSLTMIKSLRSLMAVNHIGFGDFGSIFVKTGPGSFTGLRIGITIAKIMSLLLAIPVNGKNADDDIPVLYQSSKFDR
jgi:tRNA threonylcarbamoyladenosine biosynthesis protein TsaB